MRELLLWDLREQGYCLREIAGVLGISRQRVNQLETGMIRRAVISKSRTSNPFLDPRKMVWKRNTWYVKLLTLKELEKRIDALNARYEAHLKRILKRFYWRQMTWVRHGPCPSTLFRRVWPLIERYQEKPFNFSKLIEDFPALAQEPHVSQLLSRLRRHGLLRRVGSVRMVDHNLPEVLMVRTSWEESAATQIETGYGLCLEQESYRSLQVGASNLSAPTRHCATIFGRYFASKIDPPSISTKPWDYTSAEGDPAPEALN